ncbi:MarR family winged helix-turn-helix transcriptional regulator [Pelagibacterium xiamenense]|uniref:MarR family winged helix-turn-helix transcriptional regulator n=1 Tax=Pelagibacterium xiamenense TaxID=2901140 RepID=UPI001E5E268A|nr:MarR family winged helix-turn-helix transcriptional regulator [Pelagibacterium xiamenense]MCD7059778.1 MarR family winged helix-turn-helix transcriptional regulator [Pelagibacterium xiamenense]
MSKPEDDIQSLLRGAGADPKVIEAVMDIDATLQKWRRRISKRELGKRALALLNLDIELAQLDVLFAIAAPLREFDPGEGETMVSTVAERLAIDPSRASRIVAEMVAAGYVRRAVSQADARRSILELTPAGEAVVRAVQSYKWLMMGDFLSDWTEAEITAFVPLLARFADWYRESAENDARYAREIEVLARTVADARASVKA